MPARHRRYRRVHPRLVALLAPEDVAAPAVGGATPILAADYHARSVRVAGVFHVGETLGADSVGFAAAREAGAEIWG